MSVFPAITFGFLILAELKSMQGQTDRAWLLMAMAVVSVVCQIVAIAVNALTGA